MTDLPRASLPRPSARFHMLDGKPYSGPMAARIYQKSAVVEAVKFDGTKGGIRILRQCFRTGDDKDSPVYPIFRNGKCFAAVKSLEGEVWADKGDYMVRNQTGEMYVIAGEVFKETYGEVTYEWWARELIEDADKARKAKAAEGK